MPPPPLLHTPLSSYDRLASKAPTFDCILSLPPPLPCTPPCRLMTDSQVKLPHFIAYYLMPPPPSMHPSALSSNRLTSKAPTFYCISESVPPPTLSSNRLTSKAPTFYCMLLARQFHYSMTSAALSVVYHSFAPAHHSLSSLKVCLMAIIYANRLFVIASLSI
jgi:hypothetical protein